MYVLVIASILLNIIVLLCIVILYTKLKAVENQGTPAFGKELLAYMDDTHEDNEKLLQAIEKLSKRQEKGVNGSSEPSTPPVPQISKDSAPKAIPQVGATFGQYLHRATETYSPPLETDEAVYSPPPLKEEQLYTTSNEAKILQLAEKGWTVEDIARKLNKGKTEVQLTIKMNHKKDV
ncbi:DUF6115 domain-containing protein [Aureibacillus halotolerans]|uniref:Uncharacterized protein n=1 Tax=Aureibacillus halotolerans TaxID=1508390 RepID=A0A4R6U4H2_9BACI|nr:hypothetical protein [Aureibacillus halotolerans]TDQ39673.1 hypothetical protein EV213_10740 [Aureibacillus halotolerans]